MPAALQPLVITSDSKSLHTAILDSAAFLRFGYRGFLKLLKRGSLVHIYIYFPRGEGIFLNKKFRRITVTEMTEGERKAARRSV